MGQELSHSVQVEMVFNIQKMSSVHFMLDKPDIQLMI